MSCTEYSSNWIQNGFQLGLLYCFHSLDFVSLSSGQENRIRRVLEELGYPKASNEDIEILKEVCHVMSERAARLATAGLAAIVMVCTSVYLINYLHVTILGSFLV